MYSSILQVTPCQGVTCDSLIASAPMMSAAVAVIMASSAIAAALVAVSA